MNLNVIKKVGLLAIGAVVVFLFVFFDLQRFLTLEYITESQKRFAELYSAKPLTVIGLFSLLYIAVAALSLPGAVILTVASGAFFGVAVGTIIVSFSSTIGATLACFVARFVLRDWVNTKIGDKLTPIHEGIEREGGFYLFTMRLIPIFPFFLINLAMGLTKMKFRTFFWVSQLGMLPGTIVFVNAGKELGKIDSLAGILSPTLLISFGILGLFPIIAKKLVDVIKAKYKITPGDLHD